MKLVSAGLRPVRRFATITAATIAVLVPAVAFANAPSKQKSGKAEAEAAPEPELEPEPEPEPEPEVDVEAEAESDPELEPTSTVASGMKGRVGLGGTRSLSGVNALSLRYYVADKFSLGALIGLATFTHREPDDNGDYSQKRTVGLLGAGLQAFYWPVQMSRQKYISADFGFGARGVVYVGFQPGDENPDTLDRPLEIDIEIPITTAVFIGDSVAITPEFGFVARIIPGNREPDEQDNSDSNPGSGVGERLGSSNGPGLGFELGEHGGVFFGLSITYFFGADKAAKGGGKKKKKK